MFFHFFEFFEKSDFLIFLCFFIFWCFLKKVKSQFFGVFRFLVSFEFFRFRMDFVCAGWSKKSKKTVPRKTATDERCTQNSLRVPFGVFIKVSEGAFSEALGVWNVGFRVPARGCGFVSFVKSRVWQDFVSQRGNVSFVKSVKSLRGQDFVCFVSFVKSLRGQNLVSRHCESCEFVKFLAWTDFVFRVSCVSL